MATRVLIAGGGVAALEAASASRAGLRGFASGTVVFSLSGTDMTASA